MILVYAHLRAREPRRGVGVHGEAEIGVVGTVADRLNGRVGVSLIGGVDVIGDGCAERCAHAAPDDRAEVGNVHLSAVVPDGITARDALARRFVVMRTRSRNVAAVERLVDVRIGKVTRNAAHARPCGDGARIIYVAQRDTPCGIAFLIGCEPDDAAHAARTEVSTAVRRADCGRLCHRVAASLRDRVRRDLRDKVRRHRAAVEGVADGAHADEPARDAARVCSDKGLAERFFRAGRPRGFGVQTGSCLDRADIEGLRDERVVRGAVVERAERADDAAHAVTRGDVARVIAAREAQRDARADDAAEADALRVVDDLKLVPIFFHIELFGFIAVLARRIFHFARIGGVRHGRARVRTGELVEGTDHAADVVSAGGNGRLVVDFFDGAAESVADKRADVRVAVHGAIELEIFDGSVIDIAEKSHAGERFVAVRISAVIIVNGCAGVLFGNLLLVDVQIDGIAAAVERAFERGARRRAVPAGRRAAAVDGVRDLIFLIEVILCIVTRVRAAYDRIRAHTADHAREGSIGVTDIPAELEVVAFIILGGVIGRTALIVIVVVPVKDRILALPISVSFRAEYRRFENIKIVYTIKDKRVPFGSSDARAFSENAFPLRLQGDGIHSRTDNAVLNLVPAGRSGRKRKQLSAR